MTQRATLTFGGYTFVMDLECAVALFKGLRNVELYEGKWNSVTKKSDYLIKPVPENQIALGYISDEQYSVAKLLAKAEETKEENK